MASRTAHRTNKSKPARGNGFRAQRNGRGVARYYLLYEHLSGALNDGTIPAGGALPSEPELVSPLQAVAHDRAACIGAAGGRRPHHPPPRQRHVRAPEPQAPAPAPESARLLRRLPRRWRPKRRYRSCDSRSDAVPTSLRELQPQLGARALIIQRVHRVHGAPYALTTAYVPEQYRPENPQERLERASLVTVLDQLGPRTTKTEYTTSAVAADAIAAKRLDVPLGAPLLRTRAVLIRQPRATSRRDRKSLPPGPLQRARGPGARHQPQLELPMALEAQSGAVGSRRRHRRPATTSPRTARAATGRPCRYPCDCSHPSARRISNCSAVSTPSATVLKLERARERDNGRHHRLRVLVAHQPAGERAVDLQRIDRQLGQAG